MTDERRPAPYLRPVPAKPERAPLPSDELQASAWQRTLFASTNTSLLAFVHLEALSETEFVELLVESRSKYVIDLRSVPRFDIGSLTRRSTFSIFAEVGSKYVDLSGRIGITDRRDSRLNPQIVADHIRSIVRQKAEDAVDGPIALLVETNQFLEDYVNTLSDSLQSLRPSGWDLLRIPTVKRRPNEASTASTSKKKMVFISHANPEDNEFAKWLGIQLALSGYLVWSDVTKLIGGETFWNSIEDAIRVHSAKVIVAISKASQKKNGVLDEINLAVSIERSAGIDDFVLPIRLDDLPFDEVRANLARKNIVDFSRNWAQGLDTVLKILKRDRVPKGEPNPSTVAAWSHAHSPSPARIEKVTEILSSNWLSIENLPESICFFPLNSDARSDQNGLLRDQPLVSLNNHAVSFSHPSPPQHSLSVVKIADALRDGIVEPCSMNSRQVSNLVSDLLRQSWEKFASNKGLLPYKLSSNALGWYAPASLIAGDNANFKDRTGKIRRKFLVGRSDKRNVYWHFALEARPTLARYNRFSLISHVVFTTDGHSELVSQSKMHSLRRQFCKNWWNDRWRDLTAAYLCWLFDGEPECDLLNSSSGALRISAEPLQFRCPVSVNESPEDHRYDDAVEELEWEDLDTVDTTEEMPDSDLEFSDDSE